jgi:hypothetical protein
MLDKWEVLTFIICMYVKVEYNNKEEIVNLVSTIIILFLIEEINKV